ncbi:hypothetical protein M3Y94_00601500 [Aphelenchoides besseyi]|nr:hypothetical protein M3Y94_00601500 [Aphelenchoides besseyi]KAI6222224.1 hypothetical protein M3Y95_00962100 [Aphelenchoides besseyi]
MFAALLESLRTATQFTYVIILASMFVLSCILTCYCTWRCRHNDHSSYVLDPQRSGRLQKPDREFYV